MKKELIPLRLLLGHFGIEPSIVDFDTRLQAQKTVFLAQEAGFRLGYHFGLDEQGPYSFDLADAIAELVDDLKVDASAYAVFGLPENVKEYLSTVKKVIDKSEGIPLLDWLRILATTVFACKRVPTRKEESPTDHVSRVLNETGKSDLSRFVRPAIAVLAEAGFV